ncbi:unnamed protein product, partial [Closterium sp. NIES-64]
VLAVGLHFLLLLALSLAGISWGCTLLIRGSMEAGGTAAGLAVGVIVLCLWPVLFLIFSFSIVWYIVFQRGSGGFKGGLTVGVIVLCLWPVLFLIFSFSVVWYIVVQGKFARFFVREMTEPRNEACIASFARAFWAVLRQKRLIEPSSQRQFACFFVREMTEPRNEACIASFARAFWAVLRQKRLKGHTGSPSRRRRSTSFRDSAYSLKTLQVLVGALVGAWSPTGNAVAQKACVLALALLHQLPCTHTLNDPFLLLCAGGGDGGGMESDRQRHCTASVSAHPLPAAPALPALPPALHGERPASGRSSELRGRGGAIRPFTEQGLQVVEAVSSGAEVVLFACALAMAIDWDMSSNFAGTLGLVMALSVGLAFVGQLFNHWVALGQQINRMLNPPDDERSPSHRSDGDNFSDNDDDDLEDDDDDEDFDDEDDGNSDEDDDDDDYDDDEEDDDEGDTSMDEAERVRQQ